MRGMAEVCFPCSIKSYLPSFLGFCDAKSRDFLTKSKDTLIHYQLLHGTPLAGRPSTHPFTPKIFTRKLKYLLYKAIPDSASQNSRVQPLASVSLHHFFRVLAHHLLLTLKMDEIFFICLCHILFISYGIPYISFHVAL